jgi:hypothetical protein
MAKAVPHFFMDSKAGIEIAQSAISIQLFKSCQSPFAMRVIINMVLMTIQNVIANITGFLLIVDLPIGFP